jgi:hypothetical protein
MIGLKHSDETKQIMSDAKKGENHPNFGQPKYAGALRIFNKKESLLNKLKYLI